MDAKNKWGEAHNERRRQLYQTDPERAEATRRQRRAAYRRQAEGSDKLTSTCLGNVDRITTTGALLAVRHPFSDTYVIGRALTSTDMAHLMDRTAQVIYRWQQRELFPKPVMEDDNGNLYYVDVEAERFIRIMGEHQQDTPHYRKDHDEVREKLFAASFSRDIESAKAWIMEKTK